MTFKREKEIGVLVGIVEEILKKSLHRGGSLGKSDTKYERVWALLRKKTINIASNLWGGSMGFTTPLCSALLSWPLSDHLVCAVEITFFHLSTAKFPLRAYVKSQIRSYRHRLSVYSWERLGTFHRGRLVAMATYQPSGTRLHIDRRQGHQRQDL